MAIRRRAQGASIASDAMDLFAPVLPITHATVRRMPELIALYSGLAARDLLHVATCQQEGIEEIIEHVPRFEAVLGLRRIDPVEVGPA